MNQSMRSSQKFRVRWPSRLLFISLGVCVLAIGVYLAREYTSDRQVRQIHGELIALGYPMTADERWEYHQSNSQPFDQAEMNRLTSLSQHISGTESLQELLPEHQSSRAPHVNRASRQLQNDIEFAEIYEPVLKRIPTLKLPDFTIRLNHSIVNRDLIWSTDSQKRKLNELIRIAFDAAVREKDSAKARNLLAKIDQVSNAWDWQLYTYSAYSYLNGRQFLYSTIQRSLDGSVWTEEQLQEIRDRYLVEIDYADRVQRTTLSELGEMLESDNRWYQSMPSAKLRGFQHLQQILDIAGGPISEIRARIDNWFREDEDVWNDTYTVSDLAESTASTLRYSVLNTELDRRLTLLAVATLQYEMKHQRWPNNFPELAEVGIDPQIWSDELQADFRMIRQDDFMKLEYQEYAPLQKLNGLYQERPKPVEVIVR